jgi:predicted acyl esterase
MTRSRLTLVCLLAALCCAAPATALAEAPPPGSTWHEEYFRSSDGANLHADVLRPSGLPANAKTPVVLTVSPYTNHASQTGVPDYNSSATGPSARFFDFLTQAKLFDRGYTYVMVDLPGTGGSGGCNDWGGPSEQAAVKAAVEWAASQSWSTGKVALYGKSYDGWTGLMGLAQRPKGLAAVVSQEPVVSGYLYNFMHGVRFATSVTIPASFSVVDATPGSLSDTPTYISNSPPIPACYALMAAQEQQSDETAPFWQARDLVDKVRGVTTPTFLNEGFLEDNTKPDRVFDLFNNLAGPKRAWFGQWDHVRGTDNDGKYYPIGRTTYVAEVLRFLDHYVRGLPLSDAATDRDPPVVVNSFDGKWRSEQSWPPADARYFKSSLKGGAYTDDGNNQGTGAEAGQGIWTVSQPLPHAAHLAGMPKIEFDAAGIPAANFVADVYDVAPSGKTILMSRGAQLIGLGTHYAFDLYGEDWPLAAGHRIGVLMTSSNSEWWTHVPTQATVTVSNASISLPFLAYKRDKFLEGRNPVRLDGYLAGAPFDLAAGTVSAAAQSFTLPPALAKAPATKKKAKRTARRLTAHLGALRSGGRTRGIVVYGDVPKGARVTVKLVRSGHVVATKRVRAKVNAFRVRFAGTKPGRYSARVTARVGRKTLRSSVRARRVR